MKYIVNYSKQEGTSTTETFKCWRNASLFIKAMLSNGYKVKVEQSK